MRSCNSLTIGERLTSRAITFSETDIIAFASLFDPQPYHLDRAAGDVSIFGGLCASGWQVAAFASRLLSEALLAEDIDFVDITEVEQLRWKKPLFVDDAIHVEVVVTGIEGGSPTPRCGSVNLAIDVNNTEGQLVAAMTCIAAIVDTKESVK